MPNNKHELVTIEYVVRGIIFIYFSMQFAGGFDAETMHAFEELRNLASLLNNKT